MKRKSSFTKVDTSSVKKNRKKDDKDGTKENLKMIRRKNRRERKNQRCKDHIGNFENRVVILPVPAE